MAFVRTAFVTRTLVRRRTHGCRPGSFEPSGNRLSGAHAVHEAAVLADCAGEDPEVDDRAGRLADQVDDLAHGRAALRAGDDDLPGRMRVGPAASLRKVHTKPVSSSLLRSAGMSLGSSFLLNRQRTNTRWSSSALVWGVVDAEPVLDESFDGLDHLTAHVGVFVADD